VDVVWQISSDAGVRNRVLVQMLREEGVRVASEQPEEPSRGIEYASDVQQVVAILVATGTVTAIQAGVARFRERYRSAHVTIESGEIDRQRSEPSDHDETSRSPAVRDPGSAGQADRYVDGAGVTDQIR
jgi:hypothetical protein